jgi:hypothetical protein
MEQNKRNDLVIILFLFSLFMLSSPVALWVIERTHLWFIPYVIWAVIIGFTAMLNIRKSG